MPTSIVPKKPQVSGLRARNVVISNALTRAAQRLSLAEKRILMAGVAKLGGINGEVKLSAQEYADTYGLDERTAYDQLKEAADRLLKRELSWQIQEGKAFGKLKCLWLQGYKYFEKEGHIKFLFSQYVFPHLFELQKEFTKYKLQQASSLRSVYSWRLLELMEQFHSTGWLQISIDEFCHAMEAPPSLLRNFAWLRKTVIEPAIKELIEKDGWLITWMPLKTGRRVTALRFEFQRDPQGRLNI